MLRSELSQPHRRSLMLEADGAHAFASDLLGIMIMIMFLAIIALGLLLHSRPPHETCQTEDEMSDD
ncbi:MAG TPA: hypothetical protein VG992_02785 [Candidatus Saccharimonadales bacterium]|nr:hypothetical protein [Candidatus Saccharimonadales bacterium]